MRLAAGRVLAALTLAAALGAGCAASGPAPVAPDLEPPPLRSDPALSREDALKVIEDAPDAETAIRELDDRRLGFALDAAAIEWFRSREAPGEVVDYLKKRSFVPWERLRGDVDPRSPETGEYIDPRRSDEDFAGKDRRELFSSLRSWSPFQTNRRAPSEDLDFGGSR
jgi:hypothetical protein